MPCSGKTTLARQLAPALGLPLIDKDAILEKLFDSRGVGDTAWRRGLSRESDAIFQSEARASAGAILVSFWRLPGMPLDSVTPTEWVPELSSRIVHVYCECEPEVAVQRFLRRKRHSGHLDGERSHAEVLESLRAISRLAVLEIGSRVTVDTSHELNVEAVLREIREALT